MKKAEASLKPSNIMKQSSPAGKPKGNSKVIDNAKTQLRFRLT